NRTVSPGFTLIVVAYPWIDADPDPVICQSLGGVPVWVFAQAMTRTTGGPRGPAAAAGPACSVSSACNRASTRATTATIATAGDGRGGRTVVEPPPHPHDGVTGRGSRASRSGQTMPYPLVERNHV